MSYTVTRVNKKSNLKYYVKDGFVRYVVSLDPEIKCQCHKALSVRLCDHALYILRTEFRLSDFVLEYLHRSHVHTKFVQLAQEEQPDVSEVLEAELRDLFDTDDCGIC